MPGTIDNNLRRAYVQEQLGVYLLRAVAAVAEVERPQDYGIDAIVTLLKPENGRRLIASSSFYAQLKAASVTELTYKGDELTWFKKLKLPLFIGIVDPDPMTLSLYTCHNAIRALQSSNCSTLTLYPRESPDGWNLRDPWKIVHKGDGCGSNNSTEVYLGVPVYELRPGNLADKGLLTGFCEVMEPLIAVLHRNIQWGSIRYMDLFTWTTGQPPKISGFSFSPHAPDQIISPHFFLSKEQLYSDMYKLGLPTILGELSAYAKAWAFYSILNEQPDGWDRARLLLQYLFEQGIIEQSLWDGIQQHAQYILGENQGKGGKNTPV